MPIEWVECGEHTSYPVLSIRFRDGEAKEVWSLLFDTGADRTYINVEILENERIDIDEYEILPNFARGKFFEYVEVPVNVIIVDGRRKAGGRATVRAVVNWDDSPFTGNCKEGVCLDASDTQGWCAPRNALISPKILEELRTAVTLDGKHSVLSLA